MCDAGCKSRQPYTPAMSTLAKPVVRKVTPTLLGIPHHATSQQRKQSEAQLSFSKQKSVQIQSRGDRLQEPEDPAPLGFGNQVAKHGLTDRGDHLSWTAGPALKLAFPLALLAQLSVRQGSTHDQPQQKVDRVVRAFAVSFSTAPLHLQPLRPLEDGKDWFGSQAARRNHDRDRTPKKAA